MNTNINRAVRCIWLVFLNITSVLSWVWIFVNVEVWIPFVGWKIVGIIALLVLALVIIVTAISIYQCTKTNGVE